ncbi:MAG: type II toxin-antitoxin system HicA family toxin [Candidatus Lustribacter sp.]
MLRILRRAGFVVQRTRGSHHFLAHSDGRTTTVPVHGSAPLRPGTLRGILRDVAMSMDDLR